MLEFWFIIQKRLKTAEKYSSTTFWLQAEPKSWSKYTTSNIDKQNEIGVMKQSLKIYLVLEMQTLERERVTKEEILRQKKIVWTEREQKELEFFTRQKMIRFTNLLKYCSDLNSGHSFTSNINLILLLLLFY